MIGCKQTSKYSKGNIGKQRLSGGLARTIPGGASLVLAVWREDVIPWVSWGEKLNQLAFPGGGASVYNSFRHDRTF